MAIKAADTLKPNGTFYLAEAGDISITVDGSETDLSTYVTTTAAKIGKSISSVTGPTTSGKVDTYTINYTDGTSSTFNVTNGNDGTNGDAAHVTLTTSTDDDGYTHAYVKTWEGSDESGATTSPDLMAQVNDVLAAVKEIMASYTGDTATTTSEEA